MRYLSLALLLALQGCFFGAGDPDMVKPTMAMKTAELVKHPSVDQLARYYCPQMFSKTTCTPILGSAPPTSELRFFFELRFSAGNTGELPIPIIELLLALTVFPDDQEESLGSTCVRFCPADDATCDGKPAPDSCKASEKDIDSVEDFVGAVADLVFAAANGELGRSDNLKLKVIPPHTDIEVSVVFGLGVDTVLKLLLRLAEAASNDLIKGKAVVFDIPFAARGTLFFDVPYLGRFPLSFGPFKDTWRIGG